MAWKFLEPPLLTHTRCLSSQDKLTIRPRLKAIHKSQGERVSCAVEFVRKKRVESDLCSFFISTVQYYLTTSLSKTFICAVRKRKLLGSTDELCKKFNLCFSFFPLLEFLKQLSFSSILIMREATNMKANVVIPVISLIYNSSSGSDKQI